MAKNDFQYGAWNSYTLQCGRWLWDNMPLNSIKRPPYLNSTSGLYFGHITRSRHVILHQSAKFHPNGTTLGRKKLTSYRFSIAAIFDFMGPIMGSLKSPCTTASRSSIRDHSSKLLSFLRKSRFFVFWRHTDRQTDRRTDGQARCMKPRSLSTAAA